MSTLRRFAWILCLGVVPLACVRCGDDVAGSGAILVTGRLADADTGQPVSRRTFYVHAFNDAIDKQVSLDPADSSEFALRLREPEIRLRIYDRKDKYRLYEQTFIAKAGVLDVEVRLEPTHWIVLHGRVLWRDGAGLLYPLGEGDGNVRNGDLNVGPHGLEPDEDGNYSVRASRELHQIQSINTNYVHVPKEVDLRGDLGDEHRFDVILEKR